METQLLAAVRTGELGSLDELVGAVPADVLAGDEGSELLRAAAFAGRRDVVSKLLDAGVDPSRACPEGLDPLTWAADHGASEVLQELLPASISPWRKQVPQRLVPAALEAARAWLDVDPELRLRRRLDAVQDQTVVVEREQVFVADWGLRSTRIRVTTADGRSAEVWTAHRACVTFLEDRLGIPVSRDELLARALFYADPESCDWIESLHVLTHRLEPEETFRWAADLLNHSCTDTRRFAAEALHLLSFDLPPFGAQALEVLRARLSAEEDWLALDSVIGAFSWYTGFGDLNDILPHARHPVPEIRRRVAGELASAIGEPPQAPYHFYPSRIPFDTSPDVVATLVDLTSDADGDTRAIALRTLADSGLDDSTVRAVMFAHLADEYPGARLEAAAGLALREDPHGLDLLRQMAAGAERYGQVDLRVEWVERILAHRAAES